MRLPFTWLSIAALAVLAGCAASEKPTVLPFDNTTAGYTIANGEVVFRFDPARYESVTRNDTGQWLGIGDVTIELVSVAGEFNNWSRDAWQMSRSADGSYELRVDARDFAGRSEWAFKFVINALYWVEPPADALNKAPTGYHGANRSFNLLLRVR